MSGDSAPVVDLSAARKSRPSDQVVVQLTRWLLEGQVSPGARLAGERELAQRLGGNQDSLLEAVRRLESMGLVEIRQGDGIFVLDRDSRSGLEFLRFLLKHGIGLDRKFILDLTEIRREIMSSVIRLAAGRITDRRLERLAELVRKYPGVLGPGHADLEILREIVRASGNRVYLYLLNTFQDAIVDLSILYQQLPGGSDGNVLYYRRLTDALALGDADKALAIFHDKADRDDRLLTEMLDQA